MNKITGEETSLGEFKGKVLLVVNVASKCGLTPQYEGLENLYEQFQRAGPGGCGFPANDFKAQEPGTNEEIQSLLHDEFRREVSAVRARSAWSATESIRFTRR